MVNLHQDDDGSTDDEKEAVQVGSDILNVLIKNITLFNLDLVCSPISITGWESVRFDKIIFESSDILENYQPVVKED